MLIAIYLLYYEYVWIGQVQSYRVTSQQNMKSNISCYSTNMIGVYTCRKQKCAYCRLHGHVLGDDNHVQVFQKCTHSSYYHWVGLFLLKKCAHESGLLPKGGTRMNAFSFCYPWRLSQHQEMTLRQLYGVMDLFCCVWLSCDQAMAIKGLLVSSDEFQMKILNWIRRIEWAQYYGKSLISGWIWRNLQF